MSARSTQIKLWNTDREHEEETLWTKKLPSDINKDASSPGSVRSVMR